MKILMTGITGLVGAAFTTALLRNNPSFKIVSLCRGFCGESGQSRAEKILRQQSEFAGLPETADDILSRVKIVEGTLGQLPADEMAKEGIQDRGQLVGDPMYDAFVEKSNKWRAISHSWSQICNVYTIFKTWFDRYR